MAATNKCLADSNKSRTAPNTTKKQNLHTLPRADIETLALHRIAMNFVPLVILMVALACCVAYRNIDRYVACFLGGLLGLLAGLVVWSFARCSYLASPSVMAITDWSNRHGLDSRARSPHLSAMLLRE